MNLTFYVLQSPAYVPTGNWQHVLCIKQLLVTFPLSKAPEHRWWYWLVAAAVPDRPTHTVPRAPFDRPGPAWPRHSLAVVMAGAQGNPSPISTNVRSAALSSMRRSSTADDGLHAPCNLIRAGGVRIFSIVVATCQLPTCHIWCPGSLARSAPPNYLLFTTSGFSKITPDP
jgi:hypothetical protein